LDRKAFISFFVVLLLGTAVAEDRLPPEQSKTGPTPPPGVLPPDTTRAEGILLTVPNYLWRHGCGPTAVGSVIGYWDTFAYGALIDGDATTQTAAVDQAIASGGTSGNPWSPEQHYEDYARPEDSQPTMLTDDVITSGRTPHTDDCVADWMKTSRSTENNYYGWSWSSHICPAFQSYVSSRSSNLFGSCQEITWASFSWAQLMANINGGKPLVFLVDSDGNGGTDHFVAVIGYRDTQGFQEYACWDTWNLNVRWERFRAMSAGSPWGISRIYVFSIDHSNVWWVDYNYSGTETGEFDKPFNTLTEAVTAAGNWHTIYIKASSSPKETLIITKPLYIFSWNGTAIVGH